jgi:hypothetical protein
MAPHNGPAVTIGAHLPVDQVRDLSFVIHFNSQTTFQIKYQALERLVLAMLK